jgi:hypothetical protein
MVDANIKKIKILNKDLPPINTLNEHVLRYRVISDDRNRSSEWSSVYIVPSYSIVSISGNINKVGVTTAPAGFFSVSWTDSKPRPRYDVFVKFDNAASYSYHGTATGNVYTFPNTGTINVRVAIQPEGISKTRTIGLTLFESTVIAIP